MNEFYEFDEMEEKIKTILLHNFDLQKLYFVILRNCRSLTYDLRFWYSTNIKSCWYLADFVHNTNYIEIKISFFEIKGKDNNEIKKIIIEKLEKKRGVKSENN